MIHGSRKVLSDLQPPRMSVEFQADKCLCLLDQRSDMVLSSGFVCCSYSIGEKLLKSLLTFPSDARLQHSDVRTEFLQAEF